jgi:type III pantothenate kinase
LPATALKVEKATARFRLIAVNAVEISGREFVMRLHHRLVAGLLRGGDLRLGAAFVLFEVVVRHFGPGYSVVCDSSKTDRCRAAFLKFTLTWIIPRPKRQRRLRLSPTAQGQAREPFMLLAIDAGNTNVVFALLEDGVIRARWRIATDPRRTADQYAVWLHQLIELEGLPRDVVDAVIIGTVVPRATHNLQVLAQKYFRVEPLVAGSGEAGWGIELDVAEPRSVGADRVLNAIAAHAIHQGDLIVVDFGTATTFDVVDYSGAYKGGIIAPGINLSLDALVTAAAKLPRIAIEAPGENMSVIGRTTEDQMHIGIYWGYVAMMEGLLARMKAEIGRPATVVATGGLATLFHRHTSVFDFIEPDLTLQGLGLLYQRTASAT